MKVYQVLTSDYEIIDKFAFKCDAERFANKLNAESGGTKVYHVGEVEDEE